jgi:hypothetical protein
LPRHSNVRKLPGARRRHDVFPIPDPRLWPLEVCAWLREVKGANQGPWDIAILDYGPHAAVFLEDAVTALGILDIDSSEYSTAEGFPVIRFAPCRLYEFRIRLSAAGFRVRVCGPVNRGKQVTGQTRRAAVIDIAAARESKGQRSL